MLTFANEVKPRSTTEPVAIAEHFKKRMLEWTNVLQRILIQDAHDIAEEKVEKIPIVPAGYSDDCDYWLSNLWRQWRDRTSDTGIAKEPQQVTERRGDEQT